jgi:glycerol-3-phosphate acyltransferase PlsY
VREALAVLGGYLLGSLPFGYWVPLLFRGEDIRSQGSGNVGASNVFRVYGRRLGAVVAVLDVAKGFAAASLAPLAAFLCIGVWVLTFLLTRYASVASLATALALAVLVVVLGYPWPIVAFGIGGATAVFFTHRANIRRLLAGTEHRFELRRPRRA